MADNRFVRPIDLYREIANTPKRYAYSDPSYGRIVHSVKDNPLPLPVPGNPGGGYQYGGYNRPAGRPDDEFQSGPIPTQKSGDYFDFGWRMPGTSPSAKDPVMTGISPASNESIPESEPVGVVPKDNLSVMRGLDYDPSESRRNLEWARLQYQRMLDGPRFASDDARYAGQQQQMKELEGMLNMYSSAYDKDQAYQLEQAKLDAERKRIEAEKYKADKAAEASRFASEQANAVGNYKIKRHTDSLVEIEKINADTRTLLNQLLDLQKGNGVIQPNPELQDAFEEFTGQKLVIKTLEDLERMKQLVNLVNQHRVKEAAEKYEGFIKQVSESDSTRTNTNQDLLNPNAPQ